MAPCFYNILFLPRIVDTDHGLIETSTSSRVHCPSQQVASWSYFRYRYTNYINYTDIEKKKKNQPMYVNGPDSKLLGFRPSVIAMSALRCSLDKLQTSTATSDACLTCLTSLLDHDRKVKHQNPFFVFFFFGFS